MNIEKAVAIGVCSYGIYLILKTAYENQFKDGEWNFEYDENFLGDLTGLREDKQ